MAFKSKGSTLFLTTLFVFILPYVVNGFTVELIHPASFSNPLSNSSKTRFDWIREAYYHSQSRAAAIHRSLNGGSNDLKFKTDMKHKGGGYVMNYSIGSPPFATYGIADTGSDLTWTQCQPCKKCYNQSIPIFNPKNSKSYKTVLCKSGVCSLFGQRNCTDDNICPYVVSYGDGSQTRGDVVTDTLTLGGSSFNNFVFGCGHDNGGTFDDGSSGIFGLSRDPLSLVNQLHKQIGGKFAYCFSPEPTARSHISFGQEAIVKGADAVSTPFLTGPDQASFYWLSLDSITVGDKENLKVKKAPTTTVVGGESNASTNIFVDSGTTLTLVPSNLFDNLKSALKRQISATPVDDPHGIFGLCYSTSDHIKVPKIVAHFTGADVELSPSGAYVEVEEGLSCFTIVSAAAQGLNVTIFGSLSQANYLIGYDLDAKTITFKPADCSKF